MTETMTQQTLNITEALKDHLREVAGKDESDGIKGVETYQDALVYILQNPYETQQTLDGYEETQNERIKVSENTRDTLREFKELTDTRTMERVIRDQANIERRETGEEPLDVDFPP